MGLADASAGAIDIRSLPELARCLLVAYVELATGRSHDREVSSLYSIALGLAAYDEVAHRMWRTRNRERVNSVIPELATLVIGILQTFPA
jgi:hypothetical protein